MRLFIAIELPPAIREHLAAAIGELQRDIPAGVLRWVRPEGFHITLKFLGEVPQDRVPALDAALRTGVGAGVPFDLGVGALGSFGGPGSLRVVHAHVTGDLRALEALAARVEEVCARLGFPPEARPFSPHLTLARAREAATRQQRAAAYAVISREHPAAQPTFHVERCALMRSTIARGGAIYDALHTYAMQPST